MLYDLHHHGYNEAMYLESTLQHLLSLKEQPIEIILSDGGSTDETVAIAAKYCRVIHYFKG